MSGTTDGQPQPEAAEEPEAEEIEEPSTEQEPGEEPKAPRPHDPEPDHEAVGIGIIDRPQVDTDEDV